jgi:hypothetical protein
MAAGVPTCQYACCRSRTTIMAALGGSPKHGRLVRRHIRGGCLRKTDERKDADRRADVTWPAAALAAFGQIISARGALLAGPTCGPAESPSQVYLSFCSTTDAERQAEMRLDSAALGKGRIRMYGAPGPARCWSSTITGMLFLGVSILRADLVGGPVGASRRLNGRGHRCPGGFAWASNISRRHAPSSS